MRHYKSGKVPRAITILPMLNEWEDALYLTRPDNWSEAAVRRLTNIFASSLNSSRAAVYFENVLLPHVREHLVTHQKLCDNLYMALKKSTYKPKAFYRGIVLPLCEVL